MKNMRLSYYRQKASPILKRYGVSKAALFGSCVKGKFTSKSDIDMLVDIKKDISLLDFIGLKQELESIFKRKVDLVEYSVIKPALRQSILKNQLFIFES